MVYDEHDSYGDADIQSDVLPAHVPEGFLFFFRPDRTDDATRGVARSTAPVLQSPQGDYRGRVGAAITRLSALVLRGHSEQAAITPAKRPSTIGGYDDIDPCEAGDVIGLDLVTPR